MGCNQSKAKEEAEEEERRRLEEEAEAKERAAQVAAKAKAEADSAAAEAKAKEDAANAEAAAFEALKKECQEKGLYADGMTKADMEGALNSYNDQIDALRQQLESVSAYEEGMTKEQMEKKIGDLRDDMLEKLKKFDDEAHDDMTLADLQKLITDYEAREAAFIEKLKDLGLYMEGMSFFEMEEASITYDHELADARSELEKFGVSAGDLDSMGLEDMRKLIEEANKDVARARELGVYTEGTSLDSIRKSIKDEEELLRLKEVAFDIGIIDMDHMDLESLRNSVADRKAEMEAMKEKLRSKDLYLDGMNYFDMIEAMKKYDEMIQMEENKDKRSRFRAGMQDKFNDDEKARKEKEKAKREHEAQVAARKKAAEDAEAASAMDAWDAKLSDAEHAAAARRKAEEDKKAYAKAHAHEIELEELKAQLQAHSLYRDGMTEEEMRDAYAEWLHRFNTSEPKMSDDELRAAEALRKRIEVEGSREKVREQNFMDQAKYNMAFREAEAARKVKEQRSRAEAERQKKIHEALVAAQARALRSGNKSVLLGRKTAVVKSVTQQESFI